MNALLAHVFPLDNYIFYFIFKTYTLLNMNQEICYKMWMLNDIVSEGRGETDLLPCRKKKKKELRRISLTTMEGREQHLPSPYKR